MGIFNLNKERLDTSVKLNTQTDYQYLNNSATPYAEKIRTFLNACFDLYEYGDAEKHEVLQRIRSSNEVHFHSACFELFINALLVKQGYKLQPHPELAHSEKHPDFLVTSPTGEEFYLELVTGVEDTQSTHLKNILDVLEKNTHSNFFVRVEHNNGSMKNSPKTSDFKKSIFSWLDSLDPDSVLDDIKKRMQENTGSMFDGPQQTWSHEEFEIKITAIPASPEKRGNIERMYAGGFSGLVNTKNHEIIQKSLKAKSGRYGDLDKPFIIATALRPSQFSFGLDEDDQKQALFGSYQWILDHETNISEIVFSGDGVWLYNGKPTNTRVSGIWFFDNVDCYSLERLESNLFLNPWAQIQLNNSLNEFTQKIIENDQFRTLTGTVNPRELFEIQK